MLEEGCRIDGASETCVSLRDTSRRFKTIDGIDTWT